MKITAVIEFEPGSYQKSERDSPDCPGSDCPELWGKYWRDSLEDAGICNLEPYETGSWFVPVSQIRDEQTIQIMLNSHLQDINCNSKDFLGEVSPLSGGYVLEMGKDAKIYPECCGDISNIDEWEKAALWNSFDQEMVWIGHPRNHFRKYLIPNMNLEKGIRYLKAKIETGSSAVARIRECSPLQYFSYESLFL